MQNILRRLRAGALFQAVGDLSDGQLLDAFIARGDDVAFKALLKRHGSMVLGVCRRILNNHHDAEDAFQATFLVLVRKARTITPRQYVGSWLYGVACRTAMKARAMSAKRRTKERQLWESARAQPTSDIPPDELLTRLDMELARLPEKYRVPIVLCDLEGRSRVEAARRCGWPVGTLSWRLAQGRQLLAQRLSRNGTVLTGGALALLLSRSAASAGVPPSLLMTTARAASRLAAGGALAAGTVSIQVMTLTEGVMKAMLLSKLKVAWVVALAFVIGAGAVGLGYQADAAAPQQSGEHAQSGRAAADDMDELRLEVAALRKGLEAARVRIKLLEGEVRAMKSRGAAAASTQLNDAARRLNDAARRAASQALTKYVDVDAQRRVVDLLEGALKARDGAGLAALEALSGKPDKDLFGRTETLLRLLHEDPKEIKRLEELTRIIRDNAQNIQRLEDLSRLIQQMKDVDKPKPQSSGPARH